MKFTACSFLFVVVQVGFAAPTPAFEAQVAAALVDVKGPLGTVAMVGVPVGAGLLTAKDISDVHKRLPST